MASFHVSSISEEFYILQNKRTWRLPPPTTTTKHFLNEASKPDGKLPGVQKTSAHENEQNK